MILGRNRLRIQHKYCRESQKPGFLLDFSYSIKNCRRNPVSRYLPKSQKPGFFRYLSYSHRNCRRNPVSRHLPKSQKPGFFRYLSYSAQIVAETRFLGTYPNLRNRVSSDISRTQPKLSQKPGFSPPSD